MNDEELLAAFGNASFTFVPEDSGDDKTARASLRETVLKLRTELATSNQELARWHELCDQHGLPHDPTSLVTFLQSSGKTSPPSNSPQEQTKP